MSYINDAESRFDQYSNRETKYPFGLKFLDDNTSGGSEKGTLTLFVAGAGGGKSIALVNVAAHQMLLGKNVLYITLEMAEAKISERIDAKLLGIPIWQVPKQAKQEYLTRIGKIQQKTIGDIVIRQFPTSAASVLDFRHLIHELKLKQDWEPDILIVDYLGICADARTGKADNTYTKLKHISEDIRGLAIEMKIPAFSAAQVNRSGYGNSSVDMSNLAESMALAHTADAIISIYQNEELEEGNQALLMFLKNRFGANDISGVVGLNKEYMSFYDVDAAKPDFDNSQTGKIKELVPAFSERTKEKASGLKFG
jgi:replicative DNA helicase